MSRFARVGSVEILKRFRVSLCTFADTVTNVLDEADTEISRTMMWLKQDQFAYWKGQLRKRSEEFSRAKLALKRKQQLEKTPIGGRYSYIDEKKVFALAQSRLLEARQKMDNIRRWRQQLEQESFTYKGLVQGLARAVQADVPNARAEMDRMIIALESYAALAPPRDATPATGAPYPDAATRAEQIPSMVRDKASGAAEAAGGCRVLRQRVPGPAVRERTELGGAVGGWLSGSEISAVQREQIGALDVERAAISADEKVVIARVTGEHRRIYLHRSGPCMAGDCGWYVGPADDTEPNGCEAVQVSDLLAARPDLGEILTLGPGYLLVLDGDRVEAVVDPRDKVVWPQAAGSARNGSSVAANSNKQH